MLKLFLFSLLSFLSLISVNAQSVDPSWVSQTFTFGWPGTYNSTMTRCRVLNITYLARPSAVPTPQPPFELVLITANHQPLKVPAGTNGTFLWTVNLDVGGPYLLSMYDSAGATGGTGPAFNVVDDTTNKAATCSDAGMKSATLDFNIGSVQAQCGAVPMTVTGGTPPYTVSLIAEDYPPKSAIFAGGEISWIIDIKAGINAYFTVTDTLGNGAVSQFFNIGASADSSCLGQAQTLAPGSPALSTEYPGTATASGTATGAASTGTSGGKTSNASRKLSSGLISSMMVAGLISTGFALA